MSLKSGKMREMAKFKKNDLIQVPMSEHLAHVLCTDNRYYFVRWVGGGDSMLWVDEVDRDYIKVADIVPGSADELLLYGKVPFKK